MKEMCAEMVRDDLVDCEHVYKLYNKNRKEPKVREVTRKNVRENNDVINNQSDVFRNDKGRMTSMKRKSSKMIRREEKRSKNDSK